MKKFLSILAVALSAAALVFAPTAHADPPSNWGQCVQLIQSYGFNPSIAAHGSVDGGSHVFGPAVVFFDENMNVIAEHSAQGFDFGQACTYAGFGPEHVTNFLVDEEGHFLVQVTTV